MVLNESALASAEFCVAMAARHMPEPLVEAVIAKAPHHEKLPACISFFLIPFTGYISNTSTFQSKASKRHFDRSGTAQSALFKPTLQYLLNYSS